MRYLLDTNTCIYIIKKGSPKAIQRLRRAHVGDIFISSITISELEYGISKSARPGPNRMALAEFLTPLQVVAYDDIAAKEYGILRAHLEKKGTLIGSLDMLIAAHALALECILVTNNEREFIRVPKLRVENWTK